MQYCSMYNVAYCLFFLKFDKMPLFKKKKERKEVIDKRCEERKTDKKKKRESKN